MLHNNIKFVELNLVSLASTLTRVEDGNRPPGATGNYFNSLNLWFVIPSEEISEIYQLSVIPAISYKNADTLKNEVIKDNRGKENVLRSSGVLSP